MEPTGTSRSCPSDQLDIAQRIAHNMMRVTVPSAQRPARAGPGSINGRVTGHTAGVAPVGQSTNARMPFAFRPLRRQLLR
jgi:hypothetical protein